MRDPIERVRKLLLSHDIATEKELKVPSHPILQSFAFENDNLIFDLKGHRERGEERSR